MGEVPRQLRSRCRQSRVETSLRTVDAVLREQGLIEIPEPVLRSAALGLCDLRAWLICRRSGGHAPDGKVGAAHVVSQCARCGILVAVTPAD